MGSSSHALPCPVGAKRFVPNAEALLAETLEGGVHVLHFESQVVDIANLSALALENLDEGGVARPQLIPKQLALFFKIKMAAHPKAPAVEIRGCPEVGGMDADVRKLFYHNLLCFYSLLSSSSACRDQLARKATLVGKVGRAFQEQPMVQPEQQADKKQGEHDGNEGGQLFRVRFLGAMKPFSKESFGHLAQAGGR